MRRIVAVLVIALSLFSVTPAEAWWGRHCGWGGWRHCGWRSCYSPCYTNYCGWGGYGGYGGWGGYRGYVYFPHRYRSMWGYGGYYGYAPVSTGYYVSSPYTNAYPTYTNYSAIRTANVPVATPNYGRTLKVGTTPQAVGQFLGMSDLQPVQIKAPAVSNLLARLGVQPNLTVTKPNVRIANADARRTAERHIADGDVLFRAQNFNSALQRYKLAANFAPDMAEAYWRQGHAMVATHNYELATSAFKRAIAMTDDIHRGGFHLDQIYGGAAMTKNAHLESLAEWALARPDSSEPYFLLGVFLNYDQQAERADKFFDYASDLAGMSGGHILVFQRPDAEEPVAEVAALPTRVSVPVNTGKEI